MNFVLSYGKTALSSGIVGQYLFIHKKMAIYYVGFASLFLIFLLVYRYIEIAVDGTGKKSFPVSEIFLHGAVVFLLLPIFSGILISTVSLFNYLADHVMTVEETLNLFKRFWGDEFVEHSEQRMITMRFHNILGAIAGFFGLGSAMVVMGLRYFLLSLVYLIMPIPIVISLIPFYGQMKLVEIFQTVIQISSWVLFFSLLNIILGVVTEEESVHWIQYCIVMVTYAACVLGIPSIAQKVFGGYNMHPIALTSAFMAKEGIDKAMGLSGYGKGLMGKGISGLNQSFFEGRLGASAKEGVGQAAESLANLSDVAGNPDLMSNSG